VPDRLHQRSTIAHDIVSPDSIIDNIVDVVQGLERQAENKRPPIAGDWNSFRIDASKIQVSGPYGEAGDLLVQASVDVL
jgi:hypothetical protein